MIVVDYLTLKKTKMELKLNVIKYLVYKKRFEFDSKRIARVYPDCETIDAIPNKGVINNHRYLKQKVDKLSEICELKMIRCNDMRREFLRELID